MLPQTQMFFEKLFFGVEIFQHPRIFSCFSVFGKCNFVDFFKKNISSENQAMKKIQLKVFGCNFLLREYFLMNPKAKEAA